jgi:hypothetical protein
VPGRFYCVSRMSSWLLNSSCGSSSSRYSRRQLVASLVISHSHSRTWMITSNNIDHSTKLSKWKAKKRDSEPKCCTEVLQVRHLHSRRSLTGPMLQLLVLGVLSHREGSPASTQKQQWQQTSCSPQYPQRFQQVNVHPLLHDYHCFFTRIGARRAHIAAGSAEVAAIGVQIAATRAHTCVYIVVGCGD